MPKTPQRVVGNVTGKVKELLEDLPKKVAFNQSLGIIMGAKLIQESYVEWRLLFMRLPNSSDTIKFDAYLKGRCDSIMAVLNRVRKGGNLLKIEELVLDPQVAEKIAKINKANCPPALVASPKSRL
jgi:hypothetical protein